MEKKILYLHFAWLFLRIIKNDQLYGLNIPNIMLIYLPTGFSQTIKKEVISFSISLYGFSDVFSILTNKLDSRILNNFHRWLFHDFYTFP